MNIQIEYPDHSIHNVSCYSFAKAIMPETREEIYYIEYWDTVNGKKQDSYAILENINGKWCKKDVHIPYPQLQKYTREYLDFHSLGSKIGLSPVRNDRDYEPSLQTQTMPQRESVTPPTFGHGSVEPKIEEAIEKPFAPETQTEVKREQIDPPYIGNKLSSKVVYVPLRVNYQTLSVYEIQDLERGYQLNETGSNTLDYDDGKVITDETGRTSRVYNESFDDFMKTYDTDTFKGYVESGTTKYKYAKYGQVGLSEHVKNYIRTFFNKQRQAGNVNPLVNFGDIDPLKVGDTTYVFVKDFGLQRLDFMVKELKVFLQLDGDYSLQNPLENFLMFKDPIARATIGDGNHNISSYIGLTKDKKIKMLEAQLRQKDQIIAQLNEQVETLNTGVSR